jgi:hypothetical protein
MLLKENMAMRTTLDFAPLYRSSIGFDQMRVLTNEPRSFDLAGD